MEEADISELLEGMLGKLPLGSPGASVELLIGSSCDYDVQTLINDRICGLLLQDTLTAEQVTLLGVLLKGYR